MLTELEIVLCDLNTSLCQAWQGHFADHDRVEVQAGNILELTADAIVSPANSFGFMNGGIDLAYSHFFGWELQERLQLTLNKSLLGECPVGLAVLVETGHPRIPNLICAPTMRIPMNVANTVNAYLSFRAALLSVHRANKKRSTPIRRILCPGLATATGCMPVDRCSFQMEAAYREVALGEYRRPNELLDCVEKHRSLEFGTTTDPRFQ
ncbi:MAG: macro domain-containing protein [Planctomycetota bacterium]|nr:macro domain-containing protein [Planctomycetota bacterium]